jgi:cytochrome c peroxidase
VIKKGGRTLAADPKLATGVLLSERIVLPAIVMFDRKTMNVVGVITETDALAVKSRVASALGISIPYAPALEDGRFTPYEVDMMKQMLVPGAPPPNPSNTKADDPYAALLGQALFADTRFSKNGLVSCATCHQAGKAYSDGLPTSKGIEQVDRNAPSITLASHSRWAFWDGRSDSLWSQALGPMESAAEMGSSRLRIAHHLFDHYKAEYEAAFGALPPLGDLSRFPPEGKPKDPAWDAMSAQDKDAVNRVFSNAGKAIEAHERTLRVQPSALDRYILGDKSALTDIQKDGLHTFFEVGCAQCHYGPRLTDDAFHSLRFATGRMDGMPDRGRIDAIASLEANEFNRRGAYSDSKSTEAIAMDPSMLGAFKTPTLRAMPSTAPYGHGGTFATLEDVIAVYARGGDPAEPTSVGSLERWIVKFEEKRSPSLVELMKALTGEAQN